MASERISANAAWADLSITSINGIAVLVPIGGVILALWLKPINVSFHGFREENVIGLLTGLVVIALFVERAVEVLLTPFRGKKCVEMTRQVQSEKRAMLGKEDPNSALRLAEMECQLSDFKGQTRTIAFVAGLVLGMAISASGVRGLAPLMDTRGCCPLFNALDVLLTGALVAGGADGLHRMIAAFTSLMDKTAAKAKSAQ